ncbi:hypothetical protein COT75_04935 [Candidatus Beckwithbacteria bacterium CG10_big_fil_rev_8_21_14_0_10_34_10]|uniref:Uncharacterized protein n=1 Tax=Candidatus Beckwithbacteria bacterium CG10_big_fil_rev_8_21_14_0_10_34_10 TaxID=1974495 RepID=A0A2H0W839_9BACT|nr:MAG: hypothetical protein COT75_04935 [Candidatus Beckwithbacteria bacterium CG10_big_fil_rev_8_21_14_0_10_34_10]
MSIRTKNKRQLKLAKLREKYQKTSSGTEIEKILAKVKKIAPALTKEEFLKHLKPIKEEKEE